MSWEIQTARSGDFWLTEAMSPPTRRDHDRAIPPDARPQLQGKAALAAIKGEKTLAESAKLFDVNPHQRTA